MVLHPLDGGPLPGERNSTTVPAWQAVEKKQRQAAKDWLLITQADHAQLAGDLAARLDSPIIPRLDPAIVRGIELHDAGWANFDDPPGGASAEFHPRLNDRGKPLSFLEASPAEFIAAWNGSIDAAEADSAAGAYIVSRHFCRLAEVRLNSRIDDEEDTSRLRQFLHAEGERQSRVSAVAPYSAAHLETLTDVLQFCDLLSLYLCCGAHEPVDFPQTFQGVRINTRRNEDMVRFEPAVFGAGVSLAVCGRPYGGPGHSGPRNLAFLLQ